MNGSSGSPTVNLVTFFSDLYNVWLQNYTVYKNVNKRHSRRIGETARCAQTWVGARIKMSRRRIIWNIWSVIWKGSHVEGPETVAAHTKRFGGKCRIACELILSFTGS